MKRVTSEDYGTLRSAIAAFPADVSNDAVGAQAPTAEEIFAPAAHAAALDPRVPIVVGSRGTGKSFWSGVLGDGPLRGDASVAYPRLGLDGVDVRFGFTGIGGTGGVSVDALKANVAADAGDDDAKAWWWATILQAVARANGEETSLSRHLEAARDWEARERILGDKEAALAKEDRSLLVVYDALDTVATTWPRRRLLTESLLEVVWSMRAYRQVRVKLFVRPDQIADDALRFVELPKLRTGAVRLEWPRADLYGLLFARLLLSSDESVSRAFRRLLAAAKLPVAERSEVLARTWRVTHDEEAQRIAMSALAGAFMGAGANGYKKGNTYDWPYNHLSDGIGEVTPRSFLGLMTAAAKYGDSTERVMTAEGMRHGLRAASKTRVDQLHQEFPWIKAVLAPLAGLLLPLDEKYVFDVWRRAKTAGFVTDDAKQHGYLPPFPEGTSPKNVEAALFDVLEGIGVMFRRSDGRLDMPDLYRVASKLLKKGATAPL